jgi:hypothetical protein
MDIALTTYAGSAILESCPGNGVAHGQQAVNRLLPIDRCNRSEYSDRQRATGGSLSSE